MAESILENPVKKRLICCFCLTVCRALGIPCRSVTNFDSAHDVDGSCTIDKIELEGEQIGGDSIW